MALTLVVLAAGMGSRYGGLKQLDAMGPNGETIMDYSLFDAQRAGFDRFVFVIRRHMEAAFREQILSRLPAAYDTDLAFQELDQVPDGFFTPAERVKPWGTAHAVLAAAEQVHGPFTVINADDFYGAGCFRTAAEFFAARPPATKVHEYAIVGYTLRDTLSPHGSVARGVCRADAAGDLIDIEEMTAIHQDGPAAYNLRPDGARQPLTGDEPVSMNTWAFDDSIFPLLRQSFARFLKDHGQELKSEFFIPIIARELVFTGQARIRVLPCGERWFGVTYQEDKPTTQARIRELIAAGTYPTPLW
ncbi:MAG: NTP transferase domain-containing protein [Candidatus Marinimicrobia bacterium]|nr:NTP transferase domain-containing protein [Candidatus Neomarinimicrobiota bacterium]